MERGDHHQEVAAERDEHADRMVAADIDRVAMPVQHR